MEYDIINLSEISGTVMLVFSGKKSNRNLLTPMRHMCKTFKNIKQR
jgi:hypothetical protein